MKYLRTFESINGPSVGDYVIVKSDFLDVDEEEPNIHIFNNFVNTTIGKLIKVDSSIVIISYDNVPDIIKDWFASDIESKRAFKLGDLVGDNIRSFKLSEVVGWARTKEDLEIKINANRYNI